MGKTTWIRFLLLWIAFASFAVEAQTTAPTQPPAKPTPKPLFAPTAVVPTPVPATQPVAPVAPKAEATLPEIKGHFARPQLRILGSIGNHDSGVSGTGGSINASDSSSSTAGIEGFYQWDHLSLRAGYTRTQSQFSGPTGNSPAAVDVLEDRTYFAVGMRPFAHASNKFLAEMSTSIGYYVANRTADRSTPAELVTDQTRGGLYAGAELTQAFNNDFNYRIETILYFPSRFSEAPSRTGFFKAGYELSLKSMVSYSVSRYVDVATGIFINYGRIDYAGTGDRSMSDAVETDVRYGIPLELWIFF